MTLSNTSDSFKYQCWDCSKWFKVGKWCDDRHFRCFECAQKAGQ